MLFLKLFRESILFAINALVVNKLRTLLSLLGISIGIFTIITVFTFVDYIEFSVQSSVQKLGNDVVYVQKWPWAFGSDYPWWKYFNRPNPSYRDYETLKKRVDFDKVKAMAFEIDINGKTIKYRSNSVEQVTITCASHDLTDVRTIEYEKGRYFTETESRSGKNYVIIGFNIADALFGSSDPIGKDVKILGRKLKVIGVVKKEGEDILGNSMDNQALIPINYARNLVDVRADRYQPFIMVKAQDGVSLAELNDELKNHLRSIRRIAPREEDDFALNQSSILSVQMESLFGIVNVAGWIIGGFSILVGGFGIANIMFVSVKERTNVIGIQKSLGAKNYFILLQFLFESIVLCIMGGSIGLLLVWIVTIVANFMGFGLFLSFSNIVLGLGVSVVIGLVSGYLPAQSAANLDPVEAIRAK
jgi:putative ABC transport system permease protein